MRYPVASNRYRRGMTIIYVCVSMTTLLLLASLAVDYGRVQVAKTELQAATDAAARYASTGLSDSTYLTKANTVASGNLVDGSPLVLQAGDVLTGNYASGVFTAGGSPVNAVRVSATRSASRSNGVPVLFAPGVSSCNITAVSVASYSSSAQQYGIVGLNSVNISGNVTTDSFNSMVGPYSTASAGTGGSVASNGGMNINGSVSISSDIYMTSGASLSANGHPSYGTRKTLASNLSYSVANPGNAATNNNNSALSPQLQSGNLNMSSGTLHVPAGTYYMNSFSMSGGTLDVDGAATFYINGNFSISGGTVTVNSNLASNFNVNVIASAGANFSGNSDIYINLNCPTSPINVNGNVQLYGSFIGTSLSASGNCGFHVDQALGGGGSGSTTVRTVQ